MLAQLGYLWGVAAVVWLGTFVYILVLLRRQSQLQRELEGLQQTIEELRRS